MLVAVRVLCERAKGEVRAGCEGHPEEDAKQTSGAAENVERSMYEWHLEGQERVSQEGTFNSWKLHLPAY